ncbi:unnamed protein product [Paramecium octaurelia]|uniref:Uncharacterized protein n=1 Tax=Paramecium octaurelia TaxID=43137 RepID=A0A8S1Y5Q5_PAROT|nr:unnamed protein product [Paramecium octaurelia]
MNCFCQNIHHHFLWKSDFNDEMQLKHIHQQIVKPILKIPQQEKGLIISSQICEMLNQPLLGKYFCYLQRLFIYSIFCVEINSDFLSKELDSLQQKQYQYIEFRVETDFEEDCEEFFSSHQQFFIFCQIRNQLRVKQVSLLQKTSIINIYQLEEKQIENCKREYIKISESSYFLVHFQCYSWEILNFQKEQIVLFLNNQIVLNNFNVNITYLQKVQICSINNKQNSLLINIYLITDKGYHHLNILENNLIKYNYYLEKENLEKILFNSRCLHTKLILESSHQIQEYDNINYLFIIISIIQCLCKHSRDLKSCLMTFFINIIPQIFINYISFPLTYFIKQIAALIRFYCFNFIQFAILQSLLKNTYTNQLIIDRIMASINAIKSKISNNKLIDFELYHSIINAKLLKICGYKNRLHQSQFNIKQKLKMIQKTKLLILLMNLQFMKNVGVQMKKISKH